MNMNMGITRPKCLEKDCKNYGANVMKFINDEEIYFDYCYDHLPPCSSCGKKTAWDSLCFDCDELNKRK